MVIVILIAAAVTLFLVNRTPATQKPYLPSTFVPAEAVTAPVEGGYTD
ncbi:MAG: hypothetical protein AAB588_04735 [Patescibacteria group bacterium]